ncbi:MAG: trehalose-phosphatase [Chloroflexi bacterium]|nr:trehalose-phosphatase [Chloroflexota bacterium]
MARPPVAVRAAGALGLVAPLLRSRPVLVVSDFDGTLSPINPDPWGAFIVPLARRALRRLVSVPGVHVAILSGRTAADVAGRVRVGGALYLGNHGLERGALVRRQRADSMRVATRPSPSIYGDTAERLAAELPRLITEPWLVVERKAPAVAFHYRSAPDTLLAGRRVADAVDALDPGRLLVRFPGRRVLELRPPGVVAKGEAMAELIAEIQPRLTLMLGDDRSDALAFAALRSARDAGTTDGAAIAVQAFAEAPREVAEAADVLLAAPVEAARFLAALARGLRADPAR